MSEFETENAIWRNSDYANKLFATERPALEACVKQALGPKTLQVGNVLQNCVIRDCDLPLLIRTERSDTQRQDYDLLADPAFIPFAPESFSTVILPHVLEAHELPHQVLREAHRVLSNEGHLVLSGFNPYSCVGIQRYLSPRMVFRGNYYRSGRVVDWLKVLGFEVLCVKFYQFGPLNRGVKVRRSSQFLERMLHRLLPMAGGGYMISAKKKEPGMTLVGKVKFNQAKHAKLTTAPARTALKSSIK